jgi:hypothetical protein
MTGTLDYQLDELGDAPASSRFRVGGETAVQVSRKHGPFDTRWSCAGITKRSDPVEARPLLRAAEAAEGLGWDAFSNRYFADRKRHDAEARSAYIGYRDGLEWRTTPARLRLVPVADAPTPVETGEAAGEARLLAAMALPQRRGETT